ncbi:MAG: TonB-dependent receptor plug domain-containing protein [Candidatus Wallbacteria bacterium]|nr:TonB-dependent receptor plug domain-containing protein [Candidatus Wallbacteria bacterium]
MRLSIFPILLFPLLPALASTSTEILTLPEITVYSSRLPAADSFYYKQRLGRNDFSGAGELTTALKTIPDLDLSFHNTPSALATAKLEGTDARHLLVKFDNLKLNDLFNGTFDLSLLEPEMIGNLQVVHGSASSLYGGDAPGGVIDAASPDCLEDSAGISLGSYGYQKIQVSHRLSPESSILALHKDYSGDRPEADGRQNTFFLSEKNAASSFTALFTDKNTGTPGSTSNFFWNTLGDREMDDLRLLSWSGNYTEYWKLSLGLFDSRQKQLDSSMQATNSFRSTRSNCELLWKKSNTAIGISRENFSGNAEIHSDNDYSTTWNPPVDTLDSINRSCFCNSIFSETVISHLYLSGRLDDDSGFGKIFSGNAGLKFGALTLTEYLGYKLPTFNDLYWPGGGNPNLTEEKSRGCSARISSGKGFSVRCFRTDYRDLIQWAPVNAWLWLPSNVGAARVSGVSLACKRGHFTTEGNFCKPENRVTGERLLYKEFRSARVSYQNSCTALSYNYRGRERLQDNFDILGKKVPDFRNGTGTWDLRLSGHRAFLEIDDLFNRGLLTVKEYPKVRRTWRLGFSAEF